MRIALALAAVAAALLTGCAQETIDPVRPDQCLRREMFKECMTLLPEGPRATEYNDWDEVVEACNGTAYYQSLRLNSTIKPECRAR